jgi:hypothetical protein
MPNRPKTYDRPGYREQSMKRREIDRAHAGDVAEALTERRYRVGWETGYEENGTDQIHGCEVMATSQLAAKMMIQREHPEGRNWIAFEPQSRTIASWGAGNPYDHLTDAERAELDPTLSYGVGWQDGREGRPLRGSSPEYEDGYCAGLLVRGVVVQ